MDNQSITLPAGHMLRGPERTYRIVKVLGRGGFGITYLAVANVRVGNINIEGKFAIKEHFVSSMCSRAGATHTVEYSQPVANEVDRLRRSFLKEVERIHNLPINHPNVVKINEVFEENNTAYYVMEYLGDSHLQDFVKNNGPLSPADLGLYLRPVVEAVAMLHQHNIAHYDIKPENIMMAPQEGGHNRPVLIDFGLAKHYNSQGGLTSYDGAAGYSPGYAPAEQYAGITEYSPSMDVYALGATAYYCLTGKTPPDAFRVKLNEIQAELNNIAGPRMAAAVTHAMAMTPDNRTPDAAAFLMEMGWDGAPVNMDAAPAGGATQYIQPSLDFQPAAGFSPSDGSKTMMGGVPHAPFGPGSTSQPTPSYSNPSNSQPKAPFAAPSNSQPSTPVSQSDSENGKGNGKMLWIVLGVLAGVAIGLVLYFFVIAGKGNKKGSQPAEQDNIEAPTEEKASKPQPNAAPEKAAEPETGSYEIMSYEDAEGIHEGYIDEKGEWVETNLTPKK